MNFLKNSIFSRRSGEEVQEQMPENENQMLAVWGSPGSGKTTVAVKLAARLAMQKRDVALLLCDMNTPMLPCICPPRVGGRTLPGQYPCSNACIRITGTAQLHHAQTVPSSDAFGNAEGRK